MRLVGYGLGHAGVGMTLAWHLHRVVREAAYPGTAAGAAAALVGLAVLSFVLRILEAREAEWLGQDFVMRVRRRVLMSVAEQPWEPAAASGWGVTVNRLATDLGALRNWVSSGLARVVSAGFTLSGLLMGLSFSDPPLAAWFTVVTGVGLAAGWLLARPLRRRIRRGRRERGRLANCAGRLVQSGVAMRHLGQVPVELERVHALGKALRRHQVGRAGWAGALRRLPELTQVLGVMGLLAVAASAGSGLGVPGWMGNPASGWLILAMITAALHDLARGWEHRLAYEEGRRRIRVLLARKPLVPAPAATVLPGGEPVGVHFDAVRWPGLSGDFSAVISPGERIFVVGPSGSGKSSLLRLTGRLLDPVSGVIRLNGVPLADIAELHRVVQLVSPDVPLRAGTVRQILGPDFPECPAGLWKARMAAVGITGEPALFPAGLDTAVTEGGRNLSAGARARLRLARALALNPRLLLIDEPAFLLDEAAATALRRTLALIRTTVLMASVREPTASERGSHTVWRLGPERAKQVVEPSGGG